MIISNFRLLSICIFFLFVIAGCGGGGGFLSPSGNAVLPVGSERNLSYGGQLLIETAPSASPQKLNSPENSSRRLYSPLYNSKITLLGKTVVTDVNGHYLIHFLKYETDRMTDGDSATLRIQNSRIGEITNTIKIKKNITSLSKIRVKIVSEGVLFPENPVEVLEIEETGMIQEESILLELIEVGKIIKEKITDIEGKTIPGVKGMISGRCDVSDVVATLNGNQIGTIPSSTIPYLEISEVPDSSGFYSFTIRNMDSGRNILKMSNRLEPLTAIFQRVVTTGPGIVNSNIEIVLKKDDSISMNGLTLEILSGDKQNCGMKSDLTESLITIIKNENGEAIKGIPVFFSTTAADCTVDTLKNVAGNQTEFITDYQGKAICESFLTGIICGSKTIKVTASGTTPEVIEFTINVSDNNPPTISEIDNQTINEDGDTGVLNFTINDKDVSSSLLVVSVVSDNTELVPDTETNLVPGGSDDNRTIIVKPLLNQSGIAKITIKVSDGTHVVEEDFNLTVISINDSPVMTDITDKNIQEDSSTSIISFTVSDIDTEDGLLSVSVVSDNETLVPNSPANLILGGSDGNRTLVVKPAQNQNGTATIKLSVTDGANIVSDQFVLNVGDVDDTPVITAIEDTVINEDAAGTVIPFKVNDSDTPLGSLSITAVSDNQVLVPNANLTPGGGDENRTLTITPVANENGSSNITVTVSDGTTTSSDIFILTVTPVNDSPVISAIDNQTINEDTASSVIAFDITDLETTSGELTLTGVSDNTTLVSDSKLVFGGSDGSRTLVITPSPDQNGTANITVTVNDGTASSSESFEIKVTPVNDPPVISKITNQTTNEDIATLAIGFNITDLETDSGTLIVTAVSDNPTLVPNTESNLTLGGNNGSRTLVITPAANENGISNITVTVSDGTTTSSDIFILTVAQVNDSPVISSINNQTINEDTASSSIVFDITDLETSSGELIVTGVSDNQTLVSNSNLVFDGSDGNRTLVITPSPDQNGAANITVTVNDGTASSSEVFEVNVTAVNDPPVISNIANQSTDEDTATPLIYFDITDLETISSSLVVTSVSDNPILVPNTDANLTLGGNNGSRTLVITPAANENGTANIIVSVNDGVSTVTDSFVLSVGVVNDNPVISNIANQSTNEDTATSPIAFAVSDTETPSGTLVVTAVSDNPTLVPNTVTNLSLGGSDGNRTIVITPAENENGTATITVTVSDGVNSAQDSFLISVGVVNDPPTITEITDKNTNEDIATSLIPFTVSDSETIVNILAVTAVSDNPTLVPNTVSNLILGGTDGNRTIKVNPADNENGTANITISVSDGISTTSDSFALTVTAVNDNPVITDINNQSINEDETSSSISFTISDMETAAGTLVVTAVSDNTSLVPNSNINLTLGGADGNRTLVVTPLANKNGTANITVSVTDGVNTVTDAFQLTVNAVNDFPVLTAGGTLSYAINDPAAIIDSTITLNDIDDINIESALVAISLNYRPDEDVLSFIDADGISGNWNSSAGKLVLSGEATEAEYLSALKSVKYNNSSGNPNDNSRTIEWSVNDGNLNSATVTSTINVNGYYTHTDDGNNITITGLNSGYPNILGIPSSINGMDVKKIADDAFKNSTCTSITIPEGVTSLGNQSFFNCSSLNSVTLPDSVSAIGTNSFGDCPLLTSINIPSGITAISASLFSNCTSLTSINLPDGLISIGENSFLNCTTLSTIEIPAGVNSIGDSAFDSCSNLAQAIFNGDAPATFGTGVFASTHGTFRIVCFIGKTGWTNPWNTYTTEAYSEKSVFLYTDNGTDITITGLNSGYPNSISIPYEINGKPVKSIGFGAFQNSTVTSVIIPDSVTAIGMAAFRNCSNLTSIILADNIVSIGDSAFAYCSSLNNVTLSNNLSSLGDSLFIDCTGLTSITIPAAITSLGNEVFSGCSGLTTVTIPDTVTSLGTKVFSNCSGMTSVNIGSGITSLGNEVFSGCSGLTTVTIPDTVTSLGVNVFSNCLEMTSVDIGTGVSYISEGEFSGCIKLTSVTIPSGVNSIGKSAFSGCFGLTTVSISNDVITINEEAFSNCTTLTSVTIGVNVTSIGKNAFYNCSSLNFIEIPANVDTIGDSAFGFCSDLSYIEFSGNALAPGNFGNNVFTGVDSDYEIIYSLGTTGWTNPWNTYPVSGYTNKSQFGYYDNGSGMTITGIAGGNPSFSIPPFINGRAVNNIAYRAFALRPDILSVTLPDSIVFIDNGAFFFSENLASIKLPNKLNSISESTFNGCNGLTSVIFPDSLNSVGNAAFRNCHALTILNLPEGLTSIETAAFSNCPALTEITLPESLNSISINAFDSCTNLTKVTFLGNAPVIAYGEPFQNFNVNLRIHYKFGKTGWTNPWSYVTTIQD